MKTWQPWLANGSLITFADAAADLILVIINGQECIFAIALELEKQHAPLLCFLNEGIKIPDFAMWQIVKTGDFRIFFHDKHLFCAQDHSR